MTDAEIFPKDLLRRLIRGENLAIGEAESLFEALMAGAVGEVTTSAILTALAAKGESIEEIAAQICRRSL